jgi:hypothetical protein
MGTRKQKESNMIAEMGEQENKKESKHDSRNGRTRKQKGSIHDSRNGRTRKQKESKHDSRNGRTRKQIRVITKLPNSEQSYKGKVKTHNYINRQNQSTTGKL